MKLVKVGINGKAVKEYALDDSNKTVDEMLKMAQIGFIKESEEVTLNGTIIPKGSEKSFNVSNGAIIIVNEKKRSFVRIKVGKVGSRLNEVQFEQGLNATAVLAMSGITRANNEYLFLKKESDLHYDENITSREHLYRPSTGDILVIEKIVQPLHRDTEVVVRIINTLMDEGEIDVTCDDSVLEDRVSQLLKAYKI